MTTKPRIAIVGRPNVGKSALFNRLAGKRIAIVHDQPGVTRDRIATEASLAGIEVEITDTGGIGAGLDDGFASQVQTEADIAMETADLILFVVDARTGPTPVDQELAQRLHRANTPVFLVVNKVDAPSIDDQVPAFSSLGFERHLGVSAAHGREIGTLAKKLRPLLQAISRQDREAAHQRDTDGIEAEAEGDASRLKLAIVGRPNVGKSSLVNAILNDARTIVSDVAGTTRDAVDIPYERDGRAYTLIDTAGIRRRTKRDSSVEVFSVMRSEKSIRRADLCLLVVDAAAGAVAQERRIARAILEAQKPCLIVMNKFDLYHPDGRYRDRIEMLREEIGSELFFLPFAPQIAVSAKDRSHLGRIFQEIDAIRKLAETPLSTGQLNRLLKHAMDINPPPLRGGKRLKLLYATQRREDRPRPVPVPEIMLFVNHKDLLSRNYERYLENTLRDQVSLEGLPLVFTVKSRREDGHTGRKQAS